MNLLFITNHNFLFTFVSCLVRHHYLVFLLFYHWRNMRLKKKNLTNESLYLFLNSLLSSLVQIYR